MDQQRPVKEPQELTLATQKLQLCSRSDSEWRALQERPVHERLLQEYSSEEKFV